MGEGRVQCVWMKPKWDKGENRGEKTKYEDLERIPTHVTT